MLETGKGALEAKKELTAARAELEWAVAQARQEMEACRGEIVAQLDKTALEFREKLRETLHALTTRIEKSEAAAASVSKSAHTALERSQTAIEDLASQVRQQSRALTDVARDLKDASAMLNRLQPDEITERLKAIAAAANEADARTNKLLLDAVASQSDLARRLVGLRRFVAAGLLLAMAAVALGALATAPYWVPIFERARASLSDVGR